MATNPLLGNRISLISKKNIRYEGILYSINESDATVALQNVISYGTEGREQQSNPITSFVPAQVDTVHPYLMFRGCDIKDLHVHEQPTTTTPAPAAAAENVSAGDDPAIVSSSSNNTTTTTTPPTTDNNNNNNNASPSAPSGKTKKPAVVDEEKKEVIKSNDAAAEEKENKLSQQQKKQQQNKQQKPNDENNKKEKKKEKQQQQQPSYKDKVDNGTKGSTTSTSTTRGPRKPRTNNQVGTGASLLNRKARGVVEGAGPETLKDDFDFESNLAGFNKEEDNEDEDNEGGDGGGGGAYEKNDFFDSISCDALDREQGIDNRLRGAQERKINTETFGAVALNSQRRRYYRGGRGRGRGGGRGGRGGRGSYRGGGGGGRGSRGGRPRENNRWQQHSGGRGSSFEAVRAAGDS